MTARPRVLLLYPYGPCDLVRVPDSVELVTPTEDGDLEWPGEVATCVDADSARMVRGSCLEQRWAADRERIETYDRVSDEVMQRWLAGV